MTEYATIEDVGLCGDDWQISFRRDDGSSGTLFVSKSVFACWYRSEIGRSYRADHRAGRIAEQLERRRLKFWYEGTKGYWALA